MKLKISQVSEATSVKAVLPVGLKGWFLTSYLMPNGKRADTFEIVQATPVTLVKYSADWYTTQGPVPGYPRDIPPLLISVSDLPDVERLDGMVS